MEHRLPDWLEYPSYAYELKERLIATEVNWKSIPTMAMHVSRFVDGPDMDEVYPQIFLGDCDAAMNEKYLLSNGITHVLNCAANFKGGPACVKTGPDYYKDNSITYHGLELIDLPFANITPHFEPGAEFIEKALQDGGRILVHCRQGRSRSASILIAFLMLKRHFTAAKALIMLKEAREINPNSGFLKELADLDLKLFRDKFQKWREVSSSESSDSSSDEENIGRRRKSPSEKTKRNRILQSKLREKFMAVKPKTENSHRLKHEVAVLTKVTNSPKPNRKAVANSPNRKTDSSPRPTRKVGESPNRKTANNSPSRKKPSSPKSTPKAESSPKARKNSINKLPDANTNSECPTKETEPVPPKRIVIPPPPKQYEDTIWSPSRSPSPSPPPTNAPCTVGGLLMALARVGKSGNPTSGFVSPVSTPREEEPPKAQENENSSNLIQNAVVQLKKSSESHIISEVSENKSITKTLTSSDIENTQSKEFKDNVSSEIEQNIDNCQSVDVNVDVNVNVDVCFDFTVDLSNNSTKKEHSIKPYRRTSSITKLTIIQSDDGTLNDKKSTNDSTDESNIIVDQQSLNDSKSKFSEVNHEESLTNTSNIPVLDKASPTDYLNKMDQAVEQLNEIAASKFTTEKHFSKLDNAVDKVDDIAASMMNDLPHVQLDSATSVSTSKEFSHLTLQNSDHGSSTQSVDKLDDSNDEKQTKTAASILSHVLSDALILNGLPSEYDESAESNQDSVLQSPVKEEKSINIKKEENKIEVAYVNKVFPTNSAQTDQESNDKDSADDERLENTAQEENINKPSAPTGWRKISKVITTANWKNVSLPVAPAPWKSKFEPKEEVKSPPVNAKIFPPIQQSGPKGWKAVVTSNPGSSRESPASSREASICRTRPSSPNKNTEQNPSSPVVLSKPTIFNSNSDSSNKTTVKQDGFSSKIQGFGSEIESKSNSNINQYQRSNSASNTNINNLQKPTGDIDVTIEKSYTPSPQNEQRRATCPEIHGDKSSVTTTSDNKDSSPTSPDTKNIKSCRNSPSPENVRQNTSPSPEKSRRKSSPSPDTTRRQSSPSPGPDPSKHRGSSPTNYRSRARQRPTGNSSATEKQETASLNSCRPASRQRQTSPDNIVSRGRSSITDSKTEDSSPVMNRYRPASRQRQSSPERNEIRRPSTTEESGKDSSTPVLSRWRPTSRPRPTSPVRSSSITRRRPSLTESSASTTTTVTEVRRRTSFNDKTSSTQEITHPCQLRWRPASVQRAASPKPRPEETNLNNHNSYNLDSNIRKKSISNISTISSGMPTTNYTTNLGRTENSSSSSSVQNTNNTGKSISGISKIITDQVDTKPPHASSEMTNTQHQTSSLSRSDSWRSRQRETNSDEIGKNESQVSTSSRTYKPQGSSLSRSDSWRSRQRENSSDESANKESQASTASNTYKPQASSLSRSESWRSRQKETSADIIARKESQPSTSNSTYIPRTSSPAKKEYQSQIPNSTYLSQTANTVTNTSSRRPSSPEPVSSRFRSNSLQRPSSPEPRWRSSTRYRPTSPVRSYSRTRQTSPESYTSRYSSTNYGLDKSSSVTAIGSVRLRSVSRNRATQNRPSSPERSRPRGRPTSPTTYSQLRLRSVSRTRAVSPERTVNYPSQHSSLASYGLAKSSSVTNLSMARRFPATASIVGTSTRNYSFTGSRYDSCSNLDRLDTNLERLRYKRN